MVTLSELCTKAVGKKLRLPSVSPEPITITNAEDYDGTILITGRTATTTLTDQLVEPAELETALNQAAQQKAIALVDPHQLFLLVESSRVRLAYSFDPHFAVSLSGVEALPHQIEAVYSRMLPQSRLRFLLADDPGAGKTIMTGLLIKELRMRGVLDRVLILCPAPLTTQWQEELQTKFDESFEVINGEVMRITTSGNIWSRFPNAIVSIDFARQPEVKAGLIAADFDLVVVDEAHKCSAYRYGKKIDKKQRYQLVEKLSEKADRLLLLTATPHQGNQDQFELFLQLLEPDQFGSGMNMTKKVLTLDESPWFLRRTKEQLRDFEGHRLFTNRHPFTQQFELSEIELDLYQQLTDYINTFLPRQQGGNKKQSVALARSVLQRRLASSLRAINLSLGYRFNKISQTVAELENLSQREQEERLKKAEPVEGYDEESDEDDATEEQNQAATGVISAGRLVDLKRELIELERLRKLAQRAEESGQESKLEALRKCLDRSELGDLSKPAGRLLIFTEQRDTMNYLTERLTDWGYSVCNIHGGMSMPERREAQRKFKESVQICVATEAAGEGINLQFCHLMINYDIPWNPVRLEQRMGRIHRIGQEKDVYVFNFVAMNTIEGEIMYRLLRKLDTMRTALGDRVFDVIQLVLQQNKVSVEEIMREARFHPHTKDDYINQIERMTPEKLKQFEDDTGIALATRQVDLGRVRPDDHLSEERRLMPGYIHDFFKQAAEFTGLRVEERNNGMLYIEHVLEKFRSHQLETAKRGLPQTSYRKLTFNKRDLKTSAGSDAELLSPGHPLFSAVNEVLLNKLAPIYGQAALFYDRLAQQPYRIHFFEVRLDGLKPGRGAATQTQPVYAELVAVMEEADGKRTLVNADMLHDLALAPAETALPDDIALTDEARMGDHLKWVKVKVLNGRKQERASEREREYEIRFKYLKESFEAIEQKHENDYFLLSGKVNNGEDNYALPADNAYKAWEETKQRRTRKLGELELLRSLQAANPVHLGTAIVLPVPSEISRQAGMHNDPEVEAFAMNYVMQYERDRGWEPDDISKLRDGSGFDIRSEGPLPANGGSRPLRRIEVKGRAQDNQPVDLSPNEWLKAHHLGDTYWLYIVYGCKTGQPRLVQIKNPARELAGEVQEIRVVNSYRVPADVIARRATVAQD